jgi:hypothetical protein
MVKAMTRAHVFLLVAVIALLAMMICVQEAGATGATTSVRVAKYADDGETVLLETTVSYEWMEANLPVQGDGVTRYYHQGPVFEGAVWDTDETANLKDKGAVKGTDIKDLCELVGGMSPGEEVMLRAVDGYHLELAYVNVYEPSDRQGPVALCWYKAEEQGKGYGWGYPGNDAYNNAMQIVFMAETTNGEGKHVFGNSDMLVCLPDEEYQHFYEGYPSTNGLSGKWISEVLIYSGEPPAAADRSPEPPADSASLPWVTIGLGVAGIVLLGSGGYFLMRMRATK